ncbi:polymeric immunoglobulin receptor-like isoform X1 [Pempheris klunzingeri]|uniref:polymeric immunoglobulin receptor-like isoform X1 n=1 Tax=Pempheris klunzingeri TaxID=3127111 RepID=UPI00397EAC91
MAFHLSFLAILSGLSGIHSITTVSKLSVKKGNSISIPCLYDSTYINHVKYLCKGYSWSSCSYAVKTNQPSLGSFSISDDKKHRIFTVTINDVMDKDADYYWCAVEINGGPDVKEYFHLSVAKGTPGLYVDNQEISAFKGDPISINCNYSTPGEKKWCRLGRSCVTGSSGSIDGTGVTISEMTAHAVFTVTMSKVRMENSGWYLCFKGDFQMPVHLTVTEPPTTISADKAPSTVPNAQRRGPVLRVTWMWCTALWSLWKNNLEKGLKPKTCYIAVWLHTSKARKYLAYNNILTAVEGFFLCVSVTFFHFENLCHILFSPRMKLCSHKTFHLSHFVMCVFLIYNTTNSYRKVYSTDFK